MRLNLGVSSMKNIIILVLISVSTVTFSKTIEENDLIGTWIDSIPYSLKGKAIHWLAGQSKNRLEISNNKIRFIRIFESGNNEIIEINYENMIKNDDLYIINLPRESGGKYKIVLSGWNIGSTKMLFGHFYLYNKEGLFNGWQISLSPEK